MWNNSIYYIHLLSFPVTLCETIFNAFKGTAASPRYLISSAFLRDLCGSNQRF
jgi:hypothetical protein